MTAAVTISARQESRWRCGVEHTPAAVSYEAGRWTEGELAQLRADPLLVVVDGAAAAGAAAKAPAILTTPTVQAALEAALKAADRATPDEIRTFAKRIAAVPAFAEAMGGDGFRMEMITSACRAMATGRDEASWTKAGEPKVEALEAVLDIGIDAPERDAAWESFLANDGKDLTGG